LRTDLARLRRQSGYARFVVAATVARLADEMFSVGVVLLVLERTDNPGLAGLTVAAATLPSVATGPLIGAWLDRTGRRSLLFTVDRLLLAATLVGILLATGNAPGFVVPLLAFITGLTLPATFGGFSSLIPLIVEEDELLAPANSIEAASFNAALVGGPALAGTLAAVSGPATALTVEIALTLVALVLILKIPGLDQRAGEVTGRFVSAVRRGLVHVWREPVIRAITVTAMMQLSAIGMLVVAFPLWAEGDLGAERSSGGHLVAAYAVGSMVGALLLGPRLQRGRPPEHVFFAGLLLFGALMWTWPLADSLVVALVLVALSSVPEGPSLAATFGVRQQRSPAILLAQVMTSLASLKIASFSIGAALSGPLVEALGPRDVIVVAASMQLLAVAVGAALWVTGESREDRRAVALRARGGPPGG